MHHHQGQQNGDGGMPLAPARNALAPTDRTSLDRLLLEPAAQVRRQLGGRQIPPLRMLLQTLQADRLQVPRNAAIQPPRGDGIIRQESGRSAWPARRGTATRRSAADTGPRPASRYRSAGRPGDPRREPAPATCRPASPESAPGRSW